MQVPVATIRWENDRLFIIDQTLLPGQCKEIRLDTLSIGETQEAVKAKLGKPVNVIGSKQFPDGVGEVWEYERWHAQFGFDRVEETYWLYFLNDELAQWGRPGDWSKEADRIYELRVR